MSLPIKKLMTIRLQFSAVIMQCEHKTYGLQRKKKMLGLMSPRGSHQKDNESAKIHIRVDWGEGEVKAGQADFALLSLF